jgi:hypothetical protein
MRLAYGSPVSKKSMDRKYNIHKVIDIIFKFFKGSMDGVVTKGHGGNNGC